MCWALGKDRCRMHLGEDSPIGYTRRTIIRRSFFLIIIIIIIQHLYSAIMSYADTEALVAPVKSE